MKDADRRPRAGGGEIALSIVAVLACLGLCASLYLNWLHYKVHTDASFSSMCAISEEVNCETVAMSQYSVILGLPVSYWGIAAHVLYLLVAGVGLLDARRKREAGTRGWGILSIMAAFAVAASAALFCVAHFAIGSLCPFCIAVYVVNVAIAITVAVHMFRAGTGPLSAIRADWKGFWARPAMAIAAVPAVMAAAGYAAYPLVYDVGACPGAKDSGLCTEPMTYGDPAARIKITEYSDYQCPFCAMTHFALRKAVETYPKDVVLMHVHFPLDMECNDLVDRPFHDSACGAARAAVCAERQGRFWEMNDHLFTHQKAIGRDTFGEMAADVGLDVALFEACMKDPASLDRVREDVAAAKATDVVKQGMVGTPIIYVGDESMVGALHWEDLDQHLRQKYGLGATP